MISSFFFFCPQEDVFTFDFSSVTMPGTYFVYVPGIGSSDSFVIGNDALDFAAYTISRGLYYQRCGYSKGSLMRA